MKFPRITRRTPSLLLVVLLLLPGSLLAQEPAPPTTSGDTGVSVFKDPFATGADEGVEDKVNLNDPLKPWNKVVHYFNDRTIDVVGEPVARTYRKVTPPGFRAAMGRFFQNLYEPSYTVNSLLQGEWYDATVTSRRFVINTTFGGLGFFDPAGEHLEPVERPFDQTLAKWGVGPGPYLVLPLLGPSSVRGTVGLVGDSYMDPVIYANNSVTIYGLSGFRIVDQTSERIGRYQSIMKYTVDPYAAVKNFYERQLYERKRR